MSPKDKAIELVNKIYHKTEQPIYFQTAKDCALICANEILELGVWSVYNEEELNYYREVKQEIEKLL